MPQNLQLTLDFLTDLRFNNNKTWFDENRPRYQKARKAYEDYVADVMRHFAAVEDLGDTPLKACLYRINNDLRFSKDKTPYKIWMGALVANGGRKSTERAYYLQIQPGDSMIAGGEYMPSPDNLKAIRRYIALHGDELRQILASPAFVKYFGKMEGERLKTVPKGYTMDHPYIDLLQYKQFLASYLLTDEQVLSDNLTAYTIEVCQAIKPFVGFLVDAVHG